MLSLPRVAIAGATGNVGVPILKALLDGGFPVTVLTRASSTNKIQDHPNQTVKPVDYASVDSLTEALKGVEVLVTTLAIASIESQTILVDAALAAGVSRFLPSEFGSDIDYPAHEALQILNPKIEVRRYVEKVALEHPTFSYTYLATGAFFDWGIQVGWFVNPKEHSATLYNGGDVPFSTSRLSTIGQAVVAVIKHRDETKNQTVSIHDGVTTQNKIIAAIKKVDGVEWKTETKSTDDLKKWGFEQLNQPDGNVEGALMAIVNNIVFAEGDEYGNPFPQTWNKRLGIEELSDEEMNQTTQEIFKAI